jgi:CubicO group peptidase (beta-lactamase class C family)
MNAHGQASTPIPPTPAGKRLEAFLSAFNTGDRAALRSFFEQSMEASPDEPSAVDDITNRYLGLYQQSRGLIVRKIRESSPARIRAVVQARSTGVWSEIAIFITAKPPKYDEAVSPFKIVGMGFGTTAAPEELLDRNKLSAREIRARVDSLLNTLVAADSFSGVVYVAKGAEPIYARGFGLASRTWNMPNRLDTRFNLASITKMFTAVAVARLVEQGKLSFSNKVGDVLPDYPNKDVAQKVTLHQLLSHTSGLIGARALAEKNPLPQKARTVGEMLKQFVSEPLSSPPGQRFDYSNAGYILLGAVIEKASGQSYYDYVRDHVFKPAGMRDTDFYELDTEPRNLATGFMDGPGGTRLSNIFDLDVKGSPAGGAYSTGPDMARFHAALTGLRLLRGDTLEKLWTGVTDEPGRGSRYAYGASVARYNGTRIVSHRGGWKGVTNHFDIYPDLGYTVVVLSNYDDDPAAIAYRLREWLTQGNAK